MKTAVVILPGRGTYNKAELGVLQRHFPKPDLLAEFDAFRRKHGQETLSELDGAERFSQAVHGRGDNASSLIFAASLGDYLSINRADIEVVAITGNSMGWYTALTCAGALAPLKGFEVVNTMGDLMQRDGKGGQLVYPHMPPDWTYDQDRKAALLAIVQAINGKDGQELFLSIDLGGQFVLAGNTSGLAAFKRTVPPKDRFPMHLPGHVGFHSELVSTVSDHALDLFETHIFHQPAIPMIDGRGQIWWPGACDPAELKEYTFRHQVTEPYNFSWAVAVAAREFAPDLFIVAGPGTTLGGAVAQSLIRVSWDELRSKATFLERQKTDPVLVSMGLEDQRQLVA